MPEHLPSGVRRCAARGCVEHVQVPSGPSPYCVAHADLVHRFDLWLRGVNGPPHAGGSFDVARGLWARERTARLRADAA
jgi:hypothetical protein